MVSETTPLVSTSARNRRPFPWSIVLLTILLLCAVAVGITSSVRRSRNKRSTREVKKSAAKFALTSTAFSNGGAIPSLYSRKEGENRPPPLQWEGVPPGTKSLALIVDDPDAPDPKHPKMTWVHWVVYNIPPAATSLDGDGSSLPRRTLEGRNDFKKVRYDGPQPPVGQHRYHFKLYALDTVLPDLGSDADKRALKSAMKGHVLDKVELVGTYERD